MRSNVAIVREASRLAGLALAVALAACVQEGDAGAHRDDDAAARPEAPTDRIEIPATVRSNLGIEFAEVELRDVASTLRVPGAFELRPLARREYRMALPGTVELLVDQYQPVEEGDLLFRYRSPAWPELMHEIVRGEQGIASARATIDVEHAELDEVRARLAILRARLDALADVEFKDSELAMTAAELEASVPRHTAELAKAETELANAERVFEHSLHRASRAAGFGERELAALVPSPDDDGRTVPRYATIDWIEVRARAGGVVERIGATDGGFLEPSDLVLATVDPTLVRFRARALQADLLELEGSSVARIVSAPGAETGGPGVVDATVALGLEAHPLERTIELVATPAESAPWIRPGVSAFVELVVRSTGGAALAVPRSAVVRDGLQHVVFRRNPSNPNEVLRIEADLGVDDGTWVVLKSGVMRGDEVVVSGAYELKLALQERGGVAQSGTHVHADGSVHDDH